MKFPISYEPSSHEIQIVEHFGEDGLSLSPQSLPQGLKTYVICFTNRTGSNYLAELLSTSPGLGRGGEYFNSPGVIATSRRMEFDTLQKYLEWLAQSKASEQGVLGLKLAVGQLFFLTKTGFMPTCFGDVRFIHIRRRDVLAQAISHLIAAQNKAWTSEQGSQKSDADLVLKEIQVVRMIGRIHEANAKFRTFFDIYGIKPVDVVYEDLIGNPQSVGDRVICELDFPGFEAASVTPAAVTISRQASELNRSFAARVREMYGAFQPQPPGGASREATPAATAADSPPA